MYSSRRCCASICPIKGDCKCVGGAEPETRTEEGHIKPWCSIAPSHHATCATWLSTDAKGKKWSEVAQRPEYSPSSCCVSSDSLLPRLMIDSAL